MTLTDKRIGSYSCDSNTRTFFTEHLDNLGSTHVVMWGAEEGNEDLESASPKLTDIQFDESRSGCLYSLDPNV